jgi:hypothetical protein
MKNIDDVEIEEKGMEEAVNVMVKRCLDHIVDANESTQAGVIAFATTTVTTELSAIDCDALGLDPYVWQFCPTTIGSFVVGDCESDYMEFEIFSIQTPNVERSDLGFYAPAQLAMAIRCANFDLWSDGLAEEGALVTIPVTDFGKPCDFSELDEGWQMFWNDQDDKPAHEAERKIRQIAAYTKFMMDDAYAAALIPARWS